MKGLSIRQPWVNLILTGHKTIETRTWSTKYRGDLLIVASKSPRIEPYGCAVAVVTLSDVRVMTKQDESYACCEIYPKAHSWVLTNLRPIMPIPMKGALGIFNVDLDPWDLSFTYHDPK